VQKSASNSSINEHSGESLEPGDEIRNTRVQAPEDGDHILIHTLIQGTVRHTLEENLDSDMAVAFSPDGRLLASGSADNAVKLWDPATGAVHRTLKGHSSIVNAVAFYRTAGCWHRDQPITRSSSGTPATGAVHRTLKGHTNSVRSVAFSADGKLLASGSNDGTVILWDLY
jgi:WD40 repeat protein